MLYLKALFTLTVWSAVIWAAYKKAIIDPERELREHEKMEQDKLQKRKAIHADIDILIASIPENEEA